MTLFKHYAGIDEKGNEVELTIASGPVIIKDGKVLLDKHGDDKFWKFPGGTQRGNENFEETAKREVKEELGLEIEIKESEPMLLAFMREHNGKNEHVILFHYYASVKSGEPKPERDVRELLWADINKLPEDCAPNIKPVIEYFKKKYKIE